MMEAVHAEHNKDPKNAELLINLGETALRSGDRATALESYKRATELDPRGDLRSLYSQWLGMFYEAQGQLDEALQAYQRWSELDPPALEPLDRQALILVQLERWTDLALLRPYYLRQAAAEVPRARESLALLSYALNQVGHPDETNPLERTYSALEVDSRSPTTRYLLGILLYRSGQLDSAQRELIRALELAEAQPDWVERRLGLGWTATSARLMLARLARQRGQLPQALGMLQSLRPGEVDAESMDELSTLLLDHGHYKELLELLPEQAEAGATSPDVKAPLPAQDESHRGWVRRSRALAKLGLGDVVQAERDLILEGSPTRESEAPLAEQGGLLRARELMGCKEWGQAARVLLEIVPEHNTDLRAWEMLAETYTQLGDVPKAQLAVIQSETLRQRKQSRPRPGFFWANSAEALDSPGFRFLASCSPGKANLRVTGPAAESVEPLARFALSLLQPRCELYSFEDPGYCDLHLHVAGLGRSIAETAQVREDAGAAILATLAWALRGGGTLTPPPRWTLLGRLELDGALEGPVDVGGALEWLQRLGLPLVRLVLPRSSAPDLLPIDPSLWLGRPVTFCQTVDQILEALLV